VQRAKDFLQMKSIAKGIKNLVLQAAKSPADRANHPAHLPPLENRIPDRQIRLYRQVILHLHSY